MYQSIPKADLRSSARRMSAPGAGDRRVRTGRCRIPASGAL